MTGALPRARSRGAAPALALLLCLGALLPAHGVDWCFPRSTDNQQPCPDKNQCCSVWGVCGTGTHYCKQGNCARGPCLGAPLVGAPPSPKPDPFDVPGGVGGASPPPRPAASPPPRPSPPTAKPDPFDPKPVDPVPAASPSPPPSPIHSPPPPPSPIRSPPPPPSPVRSPPPPPKPVRSPPPPPSPQPPSPPPPSPLPPTPPPPPSTTCGVIMEGQDLKGGDMYGARTVADIEACCAECARTPNCAAFTFIRGANFCYLKSSSIGWVQQGGSGMASVIMGSGGGGLLPAPAPPGDSGSPPTVNPGKPGEYQFVPMTEDQKRRMYQLTSIFENANTELQYGYAERLYDSRGITYGFCGFTTGTSDGLWVAEEFTRLRPNNPLARYLPALRAVEGKGDSFNGLNGFEEEVHKLAADPDFIKAQWTICDKEYNTPAMEICKQIHCQYALTKAQLHDALVNHGQGLGDKFSVDYILEAAQKAAGGTPATGVDEVKWLGEFLKARYKLLMDWDYTSRISVRRITMYQALLEQRNLNLDGPIYVDMEQRQGQNGQPVWQIKDTYYGKFLVYDGDDENRKLLLVT